MGLDSVELVMAFEEEFGISIPDSAAENMLTPRHVIDFVLDARSAVQRLDAQAHVVGVLARMGYANVDSQAGFNKLFRQRRRIRQWQAFCTQLTPFSAPPAKSRGPGRCILGLGILGVIVGGVYSNLSLLLAAIVGSVVGWLMSRWSMKLPEATDTLPKLLEYLKRPIPREDVAEKVKQIVLEQLGLAEADYGEDKRFVQDFGVD